MNKKENQRLFQVVKQPSPAELTDFFPFCLREETEYTLKLFLHPLTFAAVPSQRFMTSITRKIPTKILVTIQTKLMDVKFKTAFMHYFNSSICTH